MNADDPYVNDDYDVGDEYGVGGRYDGVGRRGGCDYGDDDVVVSLLCLGDADGGYRVD